ncbi:MAG: hypothetical protein JSV22_01765 [Bacteroidales bacterium]|nr:MAG: hypothetical protein JSV22_01765 [Bacteroidales bacterium]
MQKYLSNPINKKFIIGIHAGIGWAYEDKAHLYNTSASFTFDYHLKNNYFIQFAPQYSWLWKWNEHYLTIPIHIRRKFGKRLSLFAGPALTFDIGYFKDLGISAGAYYHFRKRSALAISAFTFTLYDYYIDYFYVPVSISYRYSF